MIGDIGKSEVIAWYESGSGTVLTVVHDRISS